MASKIYYAWKSASGKVGRSTEGGVLKLLRGGTRFTKLERPKQASARDRVLRVARGELGVLEQPSGSNRGQRVEKYQASTTVPGTGWPYCMAFIVWCCTVAGVPIPYRGAYVPHFEQWARAAGRWSSALPNAWAGCLVAIVFDFDSDGLADHVGWVEEHGPADDGTIEANTSPTNADSQTNGGGVHRRRRAGRIIRGYVLVSK